MLTQEQKDAIWQLDSTAVKLEYNISVALAMANNLLDNVDNAHNDIESQQSAADKAVVAIWHLKDCEPFVNVINDYLDNIKKISAELYGIDETISELIKTTQTA